jgi:hypothetical protein
VIFDLTWTWTSVFKSTLTSTSTLSWTRAQPLEPNLNSCYVTRDYEKVAKQAFPVRIRNIQFNESNIIFIFVQRLIPFIPKYININQLWIHLCIKCLHYANFPRHSKKRGSFFHLCQCVLCHIAPSLWFERMISEDSQFLHLSNFWKWRAFLKRGHFTSPLIWYTFCKVYFSSTYSAYRFPFYVPHSSATNMYTDSLL